MRNISAREVICLAVTKIETEEATGTGFFFSYKKDEARYFVVVTNSHVVGNANMVTLFIPNMSCDNPSYENAIKLELATTNITNHKDVDLCVIPLDGIDDQILDTIPAIPEEWIPLEEQVDKISYIESIYMVGYPQGSNGDKDIMPIVREGITATPYPLKYNNSPYFLVNCTCLHGSSGSPVFLYSSGFYVEEGNLKLCTERIFLLGVLFEGKFSEAKTILNGLNIPAHTNVPSNLGIAIKSKCLLDLKHVCN